MAIALLVIIIVDCAVSAHLLGRMREQGKRIDMMQDAVETLAKVLRDGFGVDDDA